MLMAAQGLEVPTRLHEAPPVPRVVDGAFERPGASGARLVFAADQTLLRGGEAGESAFLVRHGLVRLERETARGDRRIVRLAGPGEIVGQEALLGQRYAADVVACTGVAVTAIARTPRADRDDDPAWREVLADTLRALGQSQCWSAELLAGPARRRVLRLLHLLSGYAGQDGVVWLPRREEVGDMLDMALETASRQLVKLRAEGVLSFIDSRRARIDPARLAEALRESDR